MARGTRALLFMMFFFSGFCGLLYQVVWLRKAFSVFGVITPVISVVVSVFMLGLFIGSWTAGKAAKAFTRRSALPAIHLYAVAELLIGVGGVSVPYLFNLGGSYLLATGSTGSFAYLLASALAITLAMLPWCVFMGATYPLMMAFLEKYYPQEKTSFSFLYFANVIGAMAGTLCTALFMIELFGFRNTLFLGADMNVLVATAAFLLGLRHRHPAADPPAEKKKKKDRAKAVASRRDAVPFMAGTILFTTGFSSMGMEVVWTRSFTPALGTLIYSFAALLFTYLLATWLGSYLYRRHRSKDRAWSTPFLLAMLSLSAFLPVVLTDPRFPYLSRRPLLSILPFCGLLGYLTPKLIDDFSGGEPDKAGKMYAVNIAGCVLGPLAASYLLLPFFGSRVAIVILAIPIVGLLIANWKALSFKFPGRLTLGTALSLLLFSSLFVNICFEEGFEKTRSVILHDYTATVVAYGEGFNKRLLVNGIGMTRLTPITKDMAHMPLAFVKHEPRSALVICFGMGTTFRSLASWGIDVTAVELVPGVAKVFGYYHPDADTILSRPNVRIIIDDGRRYLRRTDKTYDVITIDPPPPVAAAGSSLLYSEEFYALAKSRLKPGGILQQWIPGASFSTLAAVANSLIRSFPHVRMFRSIEGWGFHFLASMNPIEAPTVSEALSRMPYTARIDRLEWDSGRSLSDIWVRLLRNEVSTEPFRGIPFIRVTDDRPYNEYYWLREGKVQNFLRLLWPDGV